jgi:hypothetical protein
LRVTTQRQPGGVSYEVFQDDHYLDAEACYRRNLGDGGNIAEITLMLHLQSSSNQYDHIILEEWSP